MPKGKRHLAGPDPLLRRARGLLMRVANETGAPPAGRQGVARPPARTITAQERRKIIGLLAELNLALKAMRQRREELNLEIGAAIARRNAVSAYHRISLLAPRPRGRAPN